jgi:hypothetical protein
MRCLTLSLPQGCAPLAGGKAAQWRPLIVGGCSAIMPLRRLIGNDVSSLVSPACLFDKDGM